MAHAAYHPPPCLRLLLRIIFLCLVIIPYCHVATLPPYLPYAYPCHLTSTPIFLNRFKLHILYYFIFISRHQCDISHPFNFKTSCMHIATSHCNMTCADIKTTSLLPEPLLCMNAISCGINRAVQLDISNYNHNHHHATLVYLRRARLATLLDVIFCICQQATLSHDTSRLVTPCTHLRRAISKRISLKSLEVRLALRSWKQSRQGDIC